MYNIQSSTSNEMEGINGEYMDYQGINESGNLITVSTRNEFKYKGMGVWDYDYAIEQVYIINRKD